MWQKNRQTDQWNKIENPEIDPHKYGQMIVDKGAKATQWSTNSFSINGADTTENSLAKNKSRCSPYTHYRLTQNAP